MKVGRKGMDGATISVVQLVRETVSDCSLKILVAIFPVVSAIGSCVPCRDVGSSVTTVPPEHPFAIQLTNNQVSHMLSLS